MRRKVYTGVIGLVAAVLFAGLGLAQAPVIGETEIGLNGERQHVRTQETNLGNLVCDVLRYYTGADVAVYNGGGIRASADLGEITLESAMEILAFNNEVVTLKMTGAEIIAVLEHGVSVYGEVAGKFLQVGGLRFFFDPDRPVGERVLMVFVDGEAIHPEKTYTLATNDFLAAGGDAYTMLEEAEQIAVADKTDQEMFIEYLQEYSPVFPVVEGRIVVW
ncbi:MAG: 5'-nucleotidase C-terminal domain-containing protein [Candidatus Bipolaricaulota bacterium]